MDTNESRNHSQEEMNLDALSGIMDQFIHDAHIGMMIDIPAESDEVIIEDNLGCGMIDAMLGLIRQELMDSLSENE